jgi:hypothetical protein
MRATKRTQKQANMKLEFILQKYLYEMGGACGAHGGVEGYIQHFGWET